MEEIEILAEKHIGKLDKHCYLARHRIESFKAGYLAAKKQLREVASKAIDMAWARIIENGKFRSYTKEEILKSLDIKEGE